MENTEGPPASATALTAENIRRLRHDRGWTLEELSGRLTELGHPLRLNVLSRMERADRRIDVDDVVALANAFGVPIDHLVRSSQQREAETAVYMWHMTRETLTDLEAQLDQIKQDVTLYRLQLRRAEEILRRLSADDEGRHVVDAAIDKVAGSSDIRAAISTEGR